MFYDILEKNLIIFCVYLLVCKRAVEVVVLVVPDDCDGLGVLVLGLAGVLVVGVVRLDSGGGWGGVNLEGCDGSHGGGCEGIVGLDSSYRGYGEGSVGLVGWCRVVAEGAVAGGVLGMVGGGGSVRQGLDGLDHLRSRQSGGDHSGENNLKSQDILIYYFN